MEERRTKLYGLIAEFEDAETLLDASRRAQEAGFAEIQAYTPFPIDGLSEFVSVRRKNWVPVIVLIGGIFGGLTGFLMQWYAAGVSYPINVGGRPLFSWPSFIPITFELTVLGGALFGAFGMLILNGLPRLFHPVFTLPQFRSATNDRFFLCVRATDEKFDPLETRKFLEEMTPSEVTTVFEP